MGEKHLYDLPYRTSSAEITGITKNIVCMVCAEYNELRRA